MLKRSFGQICVMKELSFETTDLTLIFPPPIVTEIFEMFLFAVGKEDLTKLGQIALLSKACLSAFKHEVLWKKILDHRCSTFLATFKLKWFRHPLVDQRFHFWWVADADNRGTGWRHKDFEDSATKWFSLAKNIFAPISLHCFDADSKRAQTFDECYAPDIMKKNCGTWILMKKNQILDVVTISVRSTWAILQLSFTSSTTILESLAQKV